MKAELNNSLPFVSVLMPVRNEERYIERSLGSVLAQDYPPDRFEVIVADGRSTDRTRELVRSMMKGNISVKLIDNPGMIAPTALNAAYQEAKGSILARVDGHCEIPVDYLARAVRHLVEERVDGVGGSWTIVGETPVSRSIALASAARFGVGGSSYRVTSGRDMMVDTIPFPVYLRKTIEIAGPYDEELIRDQDDEYNFRIRELGGRLLLAGDLTTIYHSRTSLRRLAKQYFQYGFWKVRVAQKHPKRMSLRHFVPSAFVLSLSSFALISLSSRKARRPLMIVAMSYTAANASVSLWLALRHGLRHLPVLTVAFASMHVGYGLGFCIGLIKFSRRWTEGSR